MLLTESTVWNHNEDTETGMVGTMKITIAMDSFKGSLSSLEAGCAVWEGIRRVYSDAEISVLPLADGGEGTAEALIYSLGGRWQQAEVRDPLGRLRIGRYGIIEQKRLAVLEMAEAAGLPLLKQEERNPLYTTTFGVGQMIRDAIQRGCRSFLLGIGGSATNDGGAGMLQALGFELLDEAGNPIGPGAEGLSHLQRISKEHALSELSQCSFRVACDVKNPLCGAQGCSAVFGPQKGADPDMIYKMDRWLAHFAELTAQVCPGTDKETPGAGAAGGLGFALLSYLNASLESGIQIVAEETHLEENIRFSDLVITGEGKLDGQTIMGKAPVGVAKLAKKYGKPVLAFAGAVDKDAGLCNAEGIDAFFPIVRRAASLEEVLESGQAKENMADTVEQVFRLIHFFRKTE